VACLGRAWQPLELCGTQACPATCFSAQSCPAAQSALSAAEPTDAMQRGLPACLPAATAQQQQHTHTPSGTRSCRPQWPARPAAAPAPLGAVQPAWRGCSAPRAPSPAAQTPSRAASAAPVGQGAAHARTGPVRGTGVQGPGLGLSIIDLKSVGSGVHGPGLGSMMKFLRVMGQGCGDAGAQGSGAQRPDGG